MKYIFLTIFSFLFLLDAYANELEIDKKFRLYCQKVQR